MSHYYIEDNFLKDRKRELIFYFSDTKFHFITNSGIFSPKSIDHASELLIKNLPKLTGSLLDLGCGYGVIGIVLYKINTIKLTMSDINQRALDCAKINCINNGTEAQIIKSDGFENIDQLFDCIVLNPPIHSGKDMLFKIYQEAYTHLNVNGKLYIVIQKKHGASSTVKKIAEIFDNCNVMYKNKGYNILMGSKYTA